MLKNYWNIYFQFESLPETKVQKSDSANIRRVRMIDHNVNLFPIEFERPKFIQATKWCRNNTSLTDPSHTYVVWDPWNRWVSHTALTTCCWTSEVLARALKFKIMSFESSFHSLTENISILSPFPRAPNGWLGNIFRLRARRIVEIGRDQFENTQILWY